LLKNSSKTKIPPQQKLWWKKNIAYESNYLTTLTQRYVYKIKKQVKRKKNIKKYNLSQKV